MKSDNQDHAILIFLNTYRPEKWSYYFIFRIKTIYFAA